MTEQTNNATTTATPDAKATQAAPNDKAAATAADTNKPAAAATGDKKPDAAAAKPAPKNFLFGKKDDAPGAEGEAAKDKPKDGDGKDGEAEDPALSFKPEELKLADGLVLDDTTKPIVTDLAEKISGAKTKQEAMQLITDAHGKMAALQLEQFEAMKQGWYDDLMADKEIGGKNADATQKRCDEVIRRFAGDPAFGGSPELLSEFQDDLMYFGLGNRKSVAKFLNNIAKATAEENSEGAGGGGKKEVKSAASVMYPDMAP